MESQPSRRKGGRSLYANDCGCEVAVVWDWVPSPDYEGLEKAIRAIVLSRSLFCEAPHTELLKAAKAFAAPARG